MNYNKLLQSNQDDDLQRRRKYIEEFTDKNLAAAASNPVADYRNAQIAKELLIKRGIQGVV